MLHKDPLQRLGSKNGAKEVLKHPWFDIYTANGKQKLRDIKKLRLTDQTEEYIWVPDQFYIHDVGLYYDVKIGARGLIGK